MNRNRLGALSFTATARARGGIGTRAMRISLFSAAMVVAFVSFPGGEAKAGAFCLTGYEGREDCSYNTFDQCRASMSGGGSFCVRNPHDPAAWARARGQ